jgi:hypothetical protein
MRARLAAIPAVVLGAGVSPWWTCGLSGRPPEDRAIQQQVGMSQRTGSGQPIGKANGSNIPISPAYQSGHREEFSPPEARHSLLPETPPIRIPERAILHALDIAQPALLGCFHRAQRVDPTMVSAKVNINLYVDTLGQVMSVQTDVTDPKFAACLTNVARRLRFPAPSALAVADLTFFAW